MLKIFSTQLAGQFQRIQSQEEFSIEDGARLLAQGCAGDGTVYVHGFSEMAAIVKEATESLEPFPGARALFNEKGEMASVQPSDRVLLFTRLASDEEAILLAQKLQQEGISTVGVSAIDVEDGFQSAVDIHIDSKLKKPMIPAEDGSRYGFPAIMTGLFVYYALRFTVEEILGEIEDLNY
ncbi:DUF2529 family protein [Bacillus mangrovi]|uniref:DUF2529 family protein n=1 Tax=Metabacillus mangrovi TaxID=1491830 RepID=A0A7X2S5L4_9BACI|nr:DUF2529 domain-containing protein [Metabacillus mangrovi]MTH54047.1 DUF2529 family protein [Metabacillus mangrovi]